MLDKGTNKSVARAILALVIAATASAQNFPTVISTVAGGGSADSVPATTSPVAPASVAVDGAGNLFIADFRNNRVRKVDTSGIITTVAGNGAASFSGDGGTATSASLNGPTSVAVDAAGNLFVADASNNRIRKVDHATQFITTVAGNGTNAFSGDGGPATSAELSFPVGVAVDSSGNVFIAETGNKRIRKVDHTKVQRGSRCILGSGERELSSKPWRACGARPRLYGGG